MITLLISIPLILFALFILTTIKKRYKLPKDKSRPIDDSPIILLPLSPPVVSLIDKKILEVVGNFNIERIHMIGIVELENMKIPCRVNPWAFKYLKEHPWLLDPSVKEITQ